MIYLILLALLGNATSHLQCGSSISDCESCFSANMKCGWCYDNGNNACYVGTSDGPLNHTCADWAFKFDMKCHLQSVKSVSFGCRIGVIIFCSIVALGTLIFWICIYPKCCAPKTEEENSNSEYQPH